MGPRLKKKLLDKTTWFKQKSKNGEKREGNGERGKCARRKGRIENKKGGKNQDPLTVLFVPRTPGGKLAIMLRKSEEEISSITGDKVKIVERAGIMVKRLVCESNPWAGSNCRREECLLCRNYQEGNGNCRRRNVLYQTSCLQCKEKGKESVYYGESSRTGFERGLEHVADIRSKDKESHIRRHLEEEHGGLENSRENNFSMKILRRHQSSFCRQIHEAVVISRNQNKNILNSKN